MKYLCKAAMMLLMVLPAYSGGDEPAQPLPPRAYWLALSVADAAKTAAWYRDHLGFREFDRMDLPERQMLIIFLELDGFVIEMAQRDDSVAPEEKLGVTKKSQVRGLYKFGFMVTDLEARVARLRKEGVQFHGNMFDDKRFGVKTIVVKDREGNLVQLFQKLTPSKP